MRKGGDEPQLNEGVQVVKMYDHGGIAK